MKKKVFVGRENELEQFRHTLDKLQAEHDNEEPYANTILVYGVGGMGKTSLCNKFTDIRESEFPSITHITIDWDLCKSRGSTFTPEELLDTVAREFLKRLHKEMEPYKNAKKDIKKVQEKIERLLERQRQSLDSVSKVADEVTTAQTGSKIAGTAVSTGLGLIGKLLSARDEKYLKEKAGVSDEKLLLYKDPVSALAYRLLGCIRTITEKKDKRIVLLMDTCELIVRVEEWFTDHFLIPLADGNPNIVLIFSGRHNPYTQRTIVIDGQSMDIRGMADRMSYPPQCIDMRLFSRRDIEKYLMEMKGSAIDIDDKVIDFVQTFSRGVPFAVDLLTNASERLGTERFIKEFGDADFRSQLKQKITDESIICNISRRFLKYCLDERGNKVDRDRIFSIAILGDTGSDILKEVWEVENPSEVLEELQAKYALFIGEGKLHDVVKDFLVDYLIENDSLRSDIAKPFAKKALPLYQKKYQEECEQEPVWEERFREDLWKEALQLLMNAMVWVSPDDAIDFFIKRSIELFLFSPTLIRKLKQPMDKFLNLEKGIRRKNRRKINAIINALETFSWDTRPDKKREELLNVLSFCSEALEEWELEPVHRAILFLIKGRTEYNQNNYEAAFNTLMDCVDETHMDKSLKNKLAEALDEIGEKFSLDDDNIFFFSEKALKASNKVVQLNDRKSSYLYHLAAMFRLGGNPKKALPYYLKSIELDSGNANVFNGLGNLYHNLKDYDKAIEMFQKAIKIDPICSYPYNGLGYLYLTMGQYTDAITNLSMSVELEPRIEFYVNLGIACYCNSETKKGIEFFKEGLSYANKSEDTRVQLNKVTALLGKEKTDEVLALLTKIAEKQVGKVLIEQFFTDLNILSSAPRPPQGIQDFIRKAKEILNYEIME